LATSQLGLHGKPVIIGLPTRLCPLVRVMGRDTVIEKGKHE
jgi:hypothetical protein